VRVVRTPRGARIEQDDVILSEILSAPGPTHGLFDVLAACVAALAPGPRFAMLGFAGGGMLGPLRAMGFPHPVDAVDLSRAGVSLFQSLSRAWAGTVRLSLADAARWLPAGNAPYDVIVEDLSTPGPSGVVKPAASFGEIPALLRARLAPGGVAVTNVLPLPGTRWDSLERRVAAPHARALVIHLEEYENRFVLAGDALPGAAEASRAVRAALRRIGSSQAGKVAVRTLARA
jgi:spermidine synthase